MRVALAALLFSRPDLLLLDEPSNHLDLEATLWLEGYLKSYPGTFILISHERGLLDSSVGRIVHLSERKLTSYRGNYERFERTRREQQRRQAALYARQQAERRHIQAFQATTDGVISQEALYPDLLLGQEILIIGI